VLDTGAGRTRLLPDEYTSSLPTTAQHDSSGVFASRRDDVVVIPSLMLGSLKVDSLEVVRGPSPYHLLGMDALGSVALRFDFDAATLSILPTGTMPAPWPLQRSPRGHPFIEVQWPGVVARACWDSGAGMTLVDVAFAELHPELFELAGSSTGTDSTGTQMEAPLYTMSACTVGGVKLAPSKAVVAPLPQSNGRMDLVFGYPAYAQANWLFDFPANRWSVQLRD
jgi:hypothetical protein